MITKPVIDILVEVQDINNVDYFDNEMKKLGFRPRGENGIGGKKIFYKRE